MHYLYFCHGNGSHLGVPVPIGLDSKVAAITMAKVNNATLPLECYYIRQVLHRIVVPQCNEPHTDIMFLVSQAHYSG
jgi:hypothetical protein